MSGRPHRLTRVVAIGFAVGSLEHLVRLLLHAFGIEVIAGYPMWRDAAFTLVDAGIAFLAFTRPHRLFVPVLAFLIEQALINGTEAWGAWRDSREVVWRIPLMIVLIGAATVIAWLARVSTESRASRSSESYV